MRTIYIVATPIGNLKDISFRAIETLKNVDVILAEDTRRSKTLLDQYSIQTPMISLHKFNEYSRISKIKELLEEGKDLALISDAGTPLISDPGANIIEYSFDNQVKIVPIPGPSSLSSILSVSGSNLTETPAVFLGFMPHKKEKTKELLNKTLRMGYSCIVFESPLRINEFLKMTRQLEIPTDLVIGRELTKIHEEVIKIKHEEKLIELKEKGEFVIFISPAKKHNNINKVTKITEDPKDTRDLSKLLANYLNIEQKKAYSILLDLKTNLSEKD